MAIDTNPQETGTSDAVVSLTAKASEKLKEIIAKQGRADLALRNPNAVSSCGCGQSFKTAGDSGTAKACAH